MRRFPPPWTIEALDGGYKIVDSNGQTLAYVYGHADQRDAGIAKALTLDEARRIAVSIASANPASPAPTTAFSHPLTGTPYFDLCLDEMRE